MGPFARRREIGDCKLVANYSSQDETIIGDKETSDVLKAEVPTGVEARSGRESSQLR